MAEARARPDVAHLKGTPEDERLLLEMVCAYVEDFETNVGRDFRERCNKFYRQYRGFKQFESDWIESAPNDKDEVLRDAKKTWGAHLHIPLSYRTIETMVPRAIANQPKMLVFPRRQSDEANVYNVRLLLNAQQQNIDIDLPFQAQMRSGRMYGIGVGKAYWLTEFATRRPVRRKMLKANEFYVGDTKQVKTFDDPMYDDVDPYDWGWDPRGSNMRTAEWTFQRSWLSLKACMKRVESKAWNTKGAKLLTEDQLRLMGGQQPRLYDEVWAERMTASGFPQMHARGSVHGENLHELIEWHDGDRVYTVLDRQVLVQDAENPCLGHMPFTIYRPTPLQGQMVGIGDLEPIEHLQRELDTLRSQRRDAATLALCAGYAYDDGLIEEDDLQFGPRAAIRVTNGRPSDALMPLNVRDVPGSGYQEEMVIKQDIDVVSGIQDESAGQVTTATEAQLVQASLSLRIQLSSRRFEIEAARDATRKFLYLNQRMIVSNREPMRIADPEMDPLEAAQQGRWKWFPVGPEQLEGEFAIVPEGGSMAQRNVPQDRQDAQAFMSLSQNPEMDARKCLLRGLELMGIEQPEAYLKASEAPVSPKVFDVLSQMGVDPQKMQIAIRAAMQQDPQLSPEQQGPNVPQVAQMMGA